MLVDAVRVACLVRRLDRFLWKYVFAGEQFRVYGDNRNRVVGFFLGVSPRVMDLKWDVMGVPFLPFVQHFFR